MMMMRHLGSVVRRCYSLPLRVSGEGIISRNMSSTSSSASARESFQGVYPIVVTPFQDDHKESLDDESFQKSIDFFRQSGVCAGVTITGVLGESNRLCETERSRLIQLAKETILDNHNQNRQTTTTITTDFHLCVGTSYTGTVATVALSQMAQELGADSVMIAPAKDGPAQLKDDDILHLYQRVAEACGPNLSIVLQDHPSSTGVHLSMDLIARIVQHVPSVRCIKLESSPTVNRLVTLQQNHSHVLDQCSLLTGLGALYAGYDLEQGLTSGFMTGFAFPEILYAMYQAARDQNYDRVHAIYHQYLPLLVLEQQQPGGLAIRKEIYRLRGLIRSSHLRHPGENLSPALSQTLQRELQRSLPGVDLTKVLLIEEHFDRPITK
eukprot:scaffold3233_cov178-Amphora_coffeaeformis.AAC.1